MYRHHQIVATVLVAVLHGNIAATAEDGTATTYKFPNDKTAARMSARMDVYGDKLPLGAVMRAGTTRFRHGSGDPTLVFSPDGKLLVSSSRVTNAERRGLAKIWDAETGKQLGQFRFEWASCVKFSPDGKRLGLAGYVPRRFNLIDGKEIATFKSHDRWRFSADFTSLGCADRNNGNVQIVEAGTGKPLARFGEVTFVDDDERPCDLRFSIDGKYLAVLVLSPSKRTYFLRSWDFATGKRLSETRVPDIDYGESWISFSPKSSVAALAVIDAVRMVDISTGREIGTLPGTSNTRGMALSPNGQSVATINLGVVSIWDTMSFRRRLVLRGHGQTAHRMCFSPDSRQLAVADSDGVIRLWNLNTGHQVNWSQDPCGEIRTALFGPAGKELVTLSTDRTIRTWDIESGFEIAQRHRSGSKQDWYSDAAMSSDGKTLAVSGRNIVQLLRVNRSNLSYPYAKLLYDQEAYFDLVRFNDKGDRILALDQYGRAAVWNLPAGDARQIQRPLKPAKTWRAPGTFAVGSAAISPNGRIVAIKRTIAGEPQKQGLWICDAATGKEIVQVGRSVRGLVFTPDGKMLAGASKNSYHFFDVTVGNELFSIEMLDPFPVIGDLARAISPDGRYLAVESVGAKVNVFEVASRRRVIELQTNQNRISAISFSHDGKLIATGGTDTTTLVWDFAHEPLGTQHARPLPNGVATAWKKAGASVGWLGPKRRDGWWEFNANRGPLDAARSVPAFKIDGWREGMLAKLPIPGRAFGLDLSYTAMTDAGLKELTGLKHLTALNLRRTQVTDAGLKELAGLKQLTWLNLGGTHITDAGVKDLAELQHLKMLKVFDTKLTGTGLKDLVGLMQLSKLDIEVTPLTDEGVKAIAELKQLTWLNLTLVEITDAMLKDLAELKQLTHLSLHGTRVTDAGLKELAELKQLKTLYLSNTKVTDTGLKTLDGLKQLTALYVGSTGVTDKGMKDLAGLKQLTTLSLNKKVTNAGLIELAELKQLTSLDLRDAQVTDAGMKHLAELKRLTSLNLRGTQVADTGLKALTGMKQLATLNLSRTQVTDAGLKELVRLTKLTTLDLRDTHATDAGIAELRKTLPNCVISR